MSRRHLLLGQRGEKAAEAFLKAKGYTILDLNYRCQWGEVDIVAQEGDSLVFVEVRTRSSSTYGTPEESITPGKWEHLVSAAESYRQSRNGLPAHWRIDVVSIRLSSSGEVQSLQHIENASLEA